MHSDASESMKTGTIPIIKTGSGTNLVAAVALVHRLLNSSDFPSARDRADLRKIFVVTDGEPLIHLDGPNADYHPCSHPKTDGESSVEHNDLTCPLCYLIHAAECARGDDESDYFQWDVDSILADEDFVHNTVGEFFTTRRTR